MLVSILTTDYGAEAWEQLRRRWSEIMEMVPPFMRRWSISSISALSQPETAADVQAFFAEVGFPDAEMYLRQRLELLEANVAMRQRETPVVAEYFA